LILQYRIDGLHALLRGVGSLGTRRTHRTPRSPDTSTSRTLDWFEVGRSCCCMMEFEKVHLAFRNLQSLPHNHHTVEPLDLTRKRRCCGTPCPAHRRTSCSRLTRSGVRESNASFLETWSGLDSWEQGAFAIPKIGNECPAAKIDKSRMTDDSATN
jgi:hypothetical protein